MWKNVVQLDRPKMAIWRRRIACWVPKATNTHSQYVLFVAFPLHQWLHHRTSLLRYIYIAAPVVYILCWGLCCPHADQILPSCRHCAKFGLAKFSCEKRNLLKLWTYGALRPATTRPTLTADYPTDAHKTLLQLSPKHFDAPWNHFRR